MKILFLLFSILLTTNLFAQDSTALKAKWKSRELLEKTFKTNRDGIGNSSFVVSVQKLMSLIRTKTTLKNLENQLAGWNSYGYENSVGFEWNDITKDHDLPYITAHYETMLSKKSYVLAAEVFGDINGRIKKLIVTTDMNGLTVAKFKQSLKAIGYLENENLTKIFRKQVWVKKGEPMFMIKSNNNGTTSIAVVNSSI